MIAYIIIVAGVAFSVVHANAQENQQESECVRPGNPYKLTSFDNDFSYLDQECYDGNGDDVLTKLGNKLKRIDIANDIKLDLGGEYRARYHSENNNARRRLGQDNSYFLSRLRVYGNLEINKHVRVYGELIDAAIAGEELQPTGSDINRHDLLNGFIDVNFDVLGANLLIRAGRQEITFGQRRNIGINNWVNTRRAFDGVRVAIKKENVTLNIFSVSPRTILPNNADPTNDAQDFDGGSIQYNIPNHEFEAFTYRLRQVHPIRTDFKIYTIGARYKGRNDNLLLEAEGAIQRGDFGAGDQRSEFFALGIGYEFKNLPWKPTIWTHYDYHSGDSNPNDGVNSTYYQLFPAAHAWLGSIDFVGRQNIKALRIRATANPTKKIVLDTQVHKFNLADSRGAFYNASRVVVRQDLTGQSGTDVGIEFDVTMTYKILERASVLVGYSRFWGGNFIDSTNPIGVSSNADFIYTHLKLNF